MATKAQVQKWMDTIVERINDIGPFVCPDGNLAVQFMFLDLKTGWMLKVGKGGTVESLVEQKEEGQATVVEFENSDTFVGLYEKTVGPTDAYFSGAMKIKGSMEALIKIIAPTTEG